MLDDEDQVLCFPQVCCPDLPLGLANQWSFGYDDLEWFILYYLVVVLINYFLEEAFQDVGRLSGSLQFEETVECGEGSRYLLDVVDHGADAGLILFEIAVVFLDPIGVDCAEVV